ncbi:MAG TPA: hypothetical protein VET47_00135 [Candidatus Limnocylindrales bacterium]|nr:hypothetical protein [Candidatus Limnocylindrales bacterium]
MLRIEQLKEKIWSTASPKAKRRMKVAEMKVKKAKKELEIARRMAERTADDSLKKELKKRYERLGNYSHLVAKNKKTNREIRKVIVEQG